MVDQLEKNGDGLNLTREVRDGILKHSKGSGKIISKDPRLKAITVEGQIVRIADIMAYLNHDLEDAVRSGVIEMRQIPEECIRVLGRTHSDRATTMVHDVVFSSGVKNGELVLSMSDEVYASMATLRRFLYKNVYRSQAVHKEFVKAKKILLELYTYFIDHEEKLVRELAAMNLPSPEKSGDAKERIVCDFIASMTDRYALALYERLFFPSPMV